MTAQLSGSAPPRSAARPTIEIAPQHQGAQLGCLRAVPVQLQPIGPIGDHHLPDTGKNRTDRRTVIGSETVQTRWPSALRLRLVENDHGARFRKLEHGILTQREQGVQGVQEPGFRCALDPIIDPKLGAGGEAPAQRCDAGNVDGGICR